MTDLFSSPVFCAAVEDIESLDVRVSQHNSQGAKPYAIVGGRSNSRWWLIPLENRHVATSGFALFQPLLASARLMKATAATLAWIGLSRLWVRQKLYINGIPSLERYFPRNEPLEFAYFTGTDSPHRKLAVQIMDRRGNLKGFAKVTRNPQVRTLLTHEAATLMRVQALGLQTAHVPKVLFSGECSNSTLLVTDTLKTPGTSSTTRFAEAHRIFLQELAQKTSDPQSVHVSEIAGYFRNRFDRLLPLLDKTWSQRLNSSIHLLEAQADLRLPVGLSHGDFTPWNTFMVKDRLYAFDWEYAEDARPLSNDLIHFILNEPRIRSQPASAKVEAVMFALSQTWTSFQQGTAPALLILYLLTQTLRQIERLPNDIQHSRTWDSAEDTALMYDQLLTQNAVFSHEH